MGMTIVNSRRDRDRDRDSNSIYGWLLTLCVLQGGERDILEYGSAKGKGERG